MTIAITKCTRCGGDFSYDEDRNLKCILCGRPPIVLDNALLIAERNKLGEGTHLTGKQGGGKEKTHYGRR